MLRAHVPEARRHQHSVLRSAEEMFVAIRLPALIEPDSDLIRAKRHDSLPVFDIFDMAGETRHSDQSFCHFEVIGKERSDPIAKDFSEVAFVTVTEKFDIARVLVNLPRSQDML